MTSNYVIKVNIPRPTAAEWRTILIEYFGDTDPLVQELDRQFRQTEESYTHLLVNMGQSDLVVLTRALKHHQVAKQVELDKVILDLRQVEDFALLSAQRHGYRDGSECKQ